MHLTRLTLDPRNAQARRDLASAYEMHRTLTRAFATAEQADPARFLWRLETGNNAWATPVVLIQSAHMGNWSALQLPPNYLHREIESKPVDLQTLVEEGRCYRFRLLANPTVARHGKRYGLASEQEQRSWLCRQGERHGFEIDAALVTASDVMVSRKGDDRINLQRASFEGRLYVREQKAFNVALVQGIGPGKAFGCGLLSVAPS